MGFDPNRPYKAKKTENIKSVHYLLCLKHIQPLSKPCFLVTFCSPKKSSGLSGSGCKKKLPDDVTFASQNYEKGSQEEPGWTPGWSQNPSQIDFFGGPTPPSPNI